jgi:anti-anti-sigma factor
MVEPAQLKIEHSSAPDGVRTLSIAGELDIATTPQLERQVDRAIAEGAQTIVIDLAGLGFIDSTGLRMFLRLNERAGSDGWRLTMVRPSEQVKKILHVTGTAGELPVTVA